MSFQAGVRLISSCQSLRRGVAIGLLAYVAGCGQAPPPPGGSINGKVTLDGKPLSAGQVVFVNTDPKATERKEVNVPVSDGIFFAAMVPIGNYKVYVLPAGSISGAPPAANSKTSPPPLVPSSGGETVKIPQKYQSAATSGLTFEVKKGDTTYAIDMTSA